MHKLAENQIYQYLADKMKVAPQYREVDTDALATIVNENSYIGEVEKFEQSFVNLEKIELSEEKLKIRLNLMFEELSEIAAAGGEDVIKHYIQIMSKKQKELEDSIDSIDTKKLDPVEVLDGLCDLQYVVSGSVIHLGFKEYFDEAFHDVHTSNMDKMYDDYTSVKHRANNYKGLPQEIIPCNKKYILKVAGKIIKPINHKKVNLKKYLND